MGSAFPGIRASSGFLRTWNPPHNPLVCIFKHNEVFTYPSTALSDKVGMGSGFPEARNPGGPGEPARVSGFWERNPKLTAVMPTVTCIPFRQKQYPFYLYNSQLEINCFVSSL